ncbi:hypothetical protein AML23_14945 [Escherichia coli]|nr:hypothetical protein AML23_14945 [Escherichia coli]
MINLPTVMTTVQQASAKTEAIAKRSKLRGHTGGSRERAASGYSTGKDIKPHDRQRKCLKPVTIFTAVRAFTELKAVSQCTVGGNNAGSD